MVACGDAGEPQQMSSAVAPAAAPIVAPPRAPAGPPLAEADRTVAPEVAAARQQVEADQGAAALPALDAWITSHPGDADALYWRARARVAAKDSAGAEVDLLSAISLDASWPNPRQQLCDLYVAGKRCAEALPHQDLLVTALPDNPTLRVNRAFCLNQAGRVEEAIADLNRACQAGLPKACTSATRLQAKQDLRSADPSAATGPAEPESQ